MVEILLMLIIKANPMADSSEMFDRVCLFVLSVSPGSRPILNKNIKYLLLILKKTKKKNT